jgi:hypothetical protein
METKQYTLEGTMGHQRNPKKFKIFSKQMKTKIQSAKTYEIWQKL